MSYLCQDDGPPPDCAAQAALVRGVHFRRKQKQGSAEFEKPQT